MKGLYEQEIEVNINDPRNLILLGVRADADIKNLVKKIEEFKSTLEWVIQQCCNSSEIEDVFSFWDANGYEKHRTTIESVIKEAVNPVTAK